MAKKGGDEEKIFAFLCYLISIIGVVIVLVTKKDRSDFSIYHARQGLVLFITWIIVAILWSILGLIPIIGWIIGWILWILVLVLWIIGMVNSLTGKKVPLPVIGGFAKSFKF
ncbi:MAG: DUF4870 domain-containing protein [Candidatus Pacearchaeota archaeon]|nr:MAG: DUF4870 domain-containing protein [Candidatus Pacearchaeota archaeon]